MGALWLGRSYGDSYLFLPLSLFSRVVSSEDKLYDLLEKLDGSMLWAGLLLVGFLLL